MTQAVRTSVNLPLPYNHICLVHQNRGHLNLQHIQSTSSFFLHPVALFCGAFTSPTTHTCMPRADCRCLERARSLYDAVHTSLPACANAGSHVHLMYLATAACSYGVKCDQPGLHASCRSSHHAPAQESLMTMKRVMSCLLHAAQNHAQFYTGCL